MAGAEPSPTTRRLPSGLQNRHGLSWLLAPVWVLVWTVYWL